MRRFRGERPTRLKLRVVVDSSTFLRRKAQCGAFRCAAEAGNRAHPAGLYNETIGEIDQLQLCRVTRRGYGQARRPEQRLFGSKKAAINSLRNIATDSHPAQSKHSSAPYLLHMARQSLACGPTAMRPSELLEVELDSTSTGIDLGLLRRIAVRDETALAELYRSTQSAGLQRHHADSA